MTQMEIPHPVLNRICSEAAGIAVGIQKLKNRSMIYQISAKESLAKKHGLPLDTYYFLPFAQWAAVKDKK